MWRTFWTGAIAVGVVLGLVMWAAASATFLFRHPRAPDVRVVIDRTTGSPVVEALAKPDKVTAQPRIKVPATTHHFGTMDPQTSGQHDFVIENTGQAPLELKLGGTSCKCTISGISDNRVPPGKSAKMTMQWNTGRYNPRFTQAALVLTNDPLKKEVEFIVEGQVRTLISVNPPEVMLNPSEPDAVLKAEFLLYSQTWQDFTLAGASANLPDLKWTIEPVSNPTEDLQATAVQRLKLEFKSPVKHGKFSEQVRIDIRSPGSQEPDHHLYVMVAGSMLRRLAFYGPTIDDRGIIELGNVPQGKTAKARLLVKVRDSELELPGAKVEAFPAFVKATFQPRAGEHKGLYDLTVELPDDLPTCQYLGDPIGRIRIDTGHPRIGVVELMVTFAVVPQ